MTGWGQAYWPYRAHGTLTPDITQTNTIMIICEAFLISSSVIIDEK